MNYSQLAAELHEAAVAKGFWAVDDALVKHCAKMLSELGEVVQADRAGIMYEVERDGAKPEGVASELADFVMMALDFCVEVEADLNAILGVSTYGEFAYMMRDDIIPLSTPEFVLHLQTAFGKMSSPEDMPEFSSALMVICYGTRMWLEDRGYDLEALIREKIAYNASRPALHGRLY